ncbi:hypothetical protein [uncultured Selenomonas sp.]|uniref:hypothetical protein n=1 Tax=uncultured Selenomonas sp. TaxID=159275 RepID=UPI0025E48280|nr:hypothetical protein [uncultured Selenomonas sp.]
MKQWNKCSKTILAMGVAAMVFGGATTTEAASNFLAEVPANDWSYETANSLISAGVVPDYDMAIPQGRVLSRLEMAMIVQQAVGNENAMTDEQKAATEKLKEAYYYDMKKLSLLNKLDTLDNSQVQSIENGGKAAGGDSFTPEERAGLKRAAELADKLTVNGYVRVRNDHFLKDKKDGTGEKRSTRANMIHVAVDTTYKINENWQGHADIGYRNSLSGFDERRSLSPNENQTGFTWDTYLTGTMPKLGLNLKFGKWNEWNIYGWGMDIDCDFSGFQFRQGKKDFKTYFTAGQMDLWDDAMGGDRTKEKVTSLRFFYPFDKKNDVNFGMSWSSPMQSRYQADDQHRVFYYYAHGHHKFDKNWDLRAGMIASNAKRDPTNEAAGTKNKQPGRWVQLTYKQAQLQNPGTYSIVADYRYEPALSWPTVTDWCGLNERFLRLGFNYVPAKNILLDTFYQWARDIDTGVKDDLYRFQAQFFF